MAEKEQKPKRAASDQLDRSKEAACAPGADETDDIVDRVMDRLNLRAKPMADKAAEAPLAAKHD